MGTAIQSRTSFPRHYSTRDINNNVGNGMWTLYYEDKTLKNGQYYDSFSSRQAMDVYFGYEKEQVRQTILKHESIFRHQDAEALRFKQENDFTLLILGIPDRCFRKEKNLVSFGSGHWGSRFIFGTCRFFRAIGDRYGVFMAVDADTEARSHYRWVRILVQATERQRDLVKAFGTHGKETCKSNDLVLLLKIRRQRDLMNEFKSRQLHKYPISAETSKSASVNNLGNTTCLQEDIQMQNVYANSKSGAQFLSKEFSQNLEGA